MNGIPCPNCGWHESEVRDSRPNCSSHRRRRRCVSCRHTYGTVEVVLPTEGVVIKPGVGMTPPTVMTLTAWTGRLRERIGEAVKEALR